MYSIAHVIVGTFLPWSREDSERVARAYVATGLSEFNPWDCTTEEALDNIDNSGLDPNENEWMEIAEGWEVMYHGSAGVKPAYVGVEIGSFTDTDHFRLATIRDMMPTAEQVKEARDLYDNLPEQVRAVLPPFDTYVVWSSS